MIEGEGIFFFLVSRGDETTKGLRVIHVPRVSFLVIAGFLFGPVTLILTTHPCLRSVWPSGMFVFRSLSMWFWCVFHDPFRIFHFLKKE